MTVRAMLDDIEADDIAATEAYRGGDRAQRTRAVG